MKNKTYKEKNNQAFYLQAKKSLGQNFLNNESVIDKISSAIDSLFEQNKEKYLHEIGPGSGALTKKLLDKNIKILAVEKDQRAVEGLAKTLITEFSNQINILNTDILKWNPDKLDWDGKYNDIKEMSKNNNLFVMYYLCGFFC